MSKQLVFGWNGSGLATNTPLLNGANAGSSQTDSEPIVSGFTFGNWFIKLTVAPGVGTSSTWTLHKNDITTGVSITIAGTNLTGQYTGAPITYAPGDTIRAVYSASGSPAAAIAMSVWELTPVTEGVQVYGFSTGTNQDNEGGWFPAISGQRGGTAADFPFASQIPTDGIITAFRCKVRTAPGVGTSRTFKLVLNGVTQDGTGGTVNTTVTVADTNVQAATSFSLSVSAGDSLAVIQNKINVPAAITWVSGNIAFNPKGNSIATSMSFNPDLSPGISYGYPVGLDNTNQSASAQNITGGLTTFKPRTVRATISAAPGAGKSRRFGLNINGFNTGLGITINDPNVGGFASVSPALEIGPNDIFTIVSTTTGIANAADARVTLSEDIQASPKKPGVIAPPPGTIILPPKDPAAFPVEGDFFVLPAYSTKVTWQTFFTTNPSAVNIQLQASLDGINFSTIDTSTVFTGGEIRTVKVSASFIRIFGASITGGSGVSVVLNALREKI